MGLRKAGSNESALRLGWEDEGDDDDDNAVVIFKGASAGIGDGDVFALHLGCEDEEDDMEDIILGGSSGVGEGDDIDESPGTVSLSRSFSYLFFFLNWADHFLSPKENTQFHKTIKLNY